MSFAPGENVGAYRIVEQLGSGGMATVYKAYHAALDRYIALKVMHPAFKGDANFLARFQREARVVAKLEHPHIVPVYDFSEHEGSPYLVMRFIEGETLKARLEGKQLTLPEILDVARPMGEALTYAHQSGVLHRDIKPSNVILSSDGGVFLTDFGLARIVHAGESSLTRDAMVGTPYYISPEQAVGKSELDARTDIYSFGVVLYELFTGRVPFQSDTPFAVVHDHIYTPLPLPTSVNPDLPLALERVLLKAMAKEADDRYDSAVELVEAVAEGVTGVAAIPPARPAAAPTPGPSAAPVETEAIPETRPEPTPIPASPPSSPPEQRRGRGLKRWLLALGGLAVIAIIAIVLIFPPTGADKEPTPQAETPTAEQAEVRPSQSETPPPARDAQFFLDQGRELAAQGDIDGALEAFQAATQQDPRAPVPYVEAARLLLGQDDLDGSLKVLFQGVESNPQDSEMRLMLAQTLVVAERWEEALPELEWLIEHEPGRAEPHAYLGVYFAFELDDMDRARAEIDQAFEIDPESPLAHFAQGVYYWKLQDFRLARQELQRAQQSPQASPWLKQRIQLLLEERLSGEKILQVGLVTDAGRIDDGSFNQSAWEGLQQAATELGAEIKYIETQDPNDYVDNIRQFADQGYDLIVTIGFALSDATIEMAHEYPDVKFIGVDQYQNETIPNLAGLIFHEDRSGYLAGALAAYLTESGTIAGVFGTDLVPAVVAFKEGYEAGARSTKPGINIISTYHPGEIGQAFNDPEWGAATAAEAIDQGADVIFAAGGMTGNGALKETATHEGLWCIGVDGDQWETVPEAHPCLVSSAMKLITPGVFDLIKMAQEEKFPGGNFYGGAGLAPFHDFEEKISQDFRDLLEWTYEGLEEGSISTGYGQ